MCVCSSGAFVFGCVFACYRLACCVRLKKEVMCVYDNVTITCRKRGRRTEVRGSVCTCLSVETNVHAQVYIQAILVSSGIIRKIRIYLRREVAVVRVYERAFIFSGP